MCVATASPTPGTIYEYNLPTFDEKATDLRTRIRFKHQVNAINPGVTTGFEPITETKPYLRITTEFMPISDIQLDPGIETIAELSTNDVEDHNEEKEELESENKKSWRTKIKGVTKIHPISTTTRGISRPVRRHLGWSLWKHQDNRSSNRTQAKLETDLSTSAPRGS